MQLASRTEFLKAVKRWTREDGLAMMLRIASIHGKLWECEKNFKQYLSRIDNHRIPKAAFDYSPAGEIWLGRFRKSC